jgi:hypothetical protein
MCVCVDRRRSAPISDPLSRAERERERERERRLAERAFLGIRRRKKVEESKQAMNRDDVDVTAQRR